MNTNQLNSLIDKISNSDNCDSTCRREKETETLKQKWLKAKQNLKSAPLRVQNAERKYYVFSEGEQGYDDMLFQRYTKTADMLKQNALAQHRDLMKNFKTMINDYNSETLYTQRMNELLKIKMKENKNLKSKLDQKLSNTLTNDRRVIYEDQQLTGLQYYRKIMTYIYFIFIVIYLIIGNFFKEYKLSFSWIGLGLGLGLGTLFSWLLHLEIGWWIGLTLCVGLGLGILGLMLGLELMIMIALPFLLNIISRLIFFIYHQIKYILNNKAPKNVYTNL